MRKELRKICATTTVAAVLLSASPIATPVVHAGWGSVIGGVIGGILNGGGNGGSNGGGNGGGSLGGLSNQQHAHPNPNDHEKLFMLAVEKNDIGTAREMLNAGVDVNGVWPSGYYSSYNRQSKTALLIAIQNNNREMMQFLLENGADVTGFYMYDNRHISYFEYVMSLNCLNHVYDNIDLAQFLLDWGADINGSSDRGKVGDKNFPLDNFPSSINDVYEDDDCVRVQFLLEHGAYTENRGFDGNTPFLRAVEYKFVRVMNVLADGGANINAKDKKGRNALQIALDSRDLQFYKQVEELMNRGQQPSQYQPSKPQPQHRTSENGGNASGDDELVTFENKSNQNTRIQELNNFNDVVIKAARAERKANEPLDRYMKDHPGVASGAEYSAILKNYLDAVKKIKDSVNPENLLGNLSHLSFDEKEICGDLLQVMNTRYDKMIEIYSRFALNRDFTPEEMDKMKVLQEEIESLGQSVIDISGRVDKLPR